MVIQQNYSIKHSQETKNKTECKQYPEEKYRNKTIHLNEVILTFVDCFILNHFYI